MDGRSRKNRRHSVLVDPSYKGEEEASFPDVRASRSHGRKERKKIKQQCAPFNKRMEEIEVLLLDRATW